MISESRIRKIVSKGPKYRFPSHINFDKFREEIASALNDSNRWCKREGVEDGALKKEQVGNDQEMAQSERNSHSINRGVGKN